MSRVVAWVLAGVLSGPLPAMAASLVKFTPQGTVASVSEVSAEFSTQVVPFGDSQQPAPMRVVCSDSTAAGSGRWLDDKRWVYAFDRPLAPGVSCKAELDPDFRTLSGEKLGGKALHEFRVGGPSVQEVGPYGYYPIDEDQVFVLRFNGKVDAASLLANAFCHVEGLGERVPVRGITGEQREAVLDAMYFTREPSDDSVQLLQCQRLLPAEGKVRLIVGPGVQSTGNDATAVSTKAQHFDFEVRKPFRAEFSCMRENANADCTPVSGVGVSFSAPIPREEARKIRLRTPTQEIVPAPDDDAFDADVTNVWFEGPFPEKAQLTLTLPEGLKDDAGRTLSNAGDFPLGFRTAAYPSLVKFAAAPFGVVERFAEAPSGGSDDDYPAVVPVTVRNVESALGADALSVSPGTVNGLSTQNDIEVLRWYARLQRLEQGRWSAGQLSAIMADREPSYGNNETQIDVRGFSALRGQPNVVRRVLPGASGRDQRPFEVIGVPLSGPGFHVLEIESAQLGRSLLEDGQPMYVRTGILMTNLAVHVKKGRDDLLVWVTTLDEGQVVPDAQVSVLSCDGSQLASGVTGVHGALHLTDPMEYPEYCSSTGLGGVYVSARIPADHPQARGKAEFSFAFSGWDRGIEPWRFNIPVSTSPTPTVKAHTVFDRTLLRAGETVSMKHYIRSLTRDGFALPSQEALPDRLVVMHDGSGQEYEQKIEWQASESGGLSAQNVMELPKTARLGSYSVYLRGENYVWHETGSFNVEEFVLPLLTGNLQISGPKQDGVLVAPAAVDASVQLAYVSGGAASGLDVQLSAVARDMPVSFEGYEAYEFSPPYPGEGSGEDAEGASQPVGQRLFLDKAAVRLDGAGGASVPVEKLPQVSRPQQWLFEASFRDPNGQVQTLSQTANVWPSAVQAGIRVSRWVQVGQSAEIHVVALSPSGKPLPETQVSVTASSRTTYSTRKRLVGGFYSYDSHTQTRTLGKVCEGKTDARGTLVCSMELNTPGEIQFNARALDGQGRASVAQSSVWVTGGDELWFGGESADRIDLIPDKRSYAPGDVAEFQVRMPFRQATALLAVEREGVLAMQVVELEGKDPTIRLGIRPEWGPNVYVSVLALRGRLRQTSWHSFFSWGWQRPTQWYKAFRSSDQGYAAPTPFIDLAKPAFRHGVAEVQVSDVNDQLLVDVAPEKPSYRVRDTATVNIRVALPDGKPASNATVAFAAVDQALLELSPNRSWDLLDAMRQRRSYGVRTATTQLEVIGRRHYGRKALPAGGGGGKSPTRELLDTLLLWEPEIKLDAQGRGRIQVPLNDAITQFALVAIADHGVSRFGTGKSSLVTAQDMQVIGGIPPQVREGDAYEAMVTVRNTTSRFMQVEVTASYRQGESGDAVSLSPQTIGLAAGSASAVRWNVQAPVLATDAGQAELQWELRAIERNAPGGEQAEDALRISQRLAPDVPVRVRQATLLPLDADNPVSLPIALPKRALRLPSGEPRGDLRISLRSRLAVGGMPGVHDWFEAYPYTCTEQLASRAIGMRDTGQWKALVARLPDMLDSDGLLAYFPGMRQGNEVLTAYILSASHEARSMGLSFALPAALEQRMLQGLQAFAQGRIERVRWSPQRDLDLRKLTAIEALSRYDAASPRLVDSIAIEPERWPVGALVDWMQILQRMPKLKDRDGQLRKVDAELRSRLLSRGTQTLVGDSGPQASWWLMHSRATEQARLLLAVTDQLSWSEDVPRIAQGLLAMQTNGAWRTTTENLLGSLALERFSRQFERKPVKGRTLVSLGGGRDSAVDWNALPAGAAADDLSQAWPASEETQPLDLRHEGSGRVWVDVQARAAVPHTQPIAAGFSLDRSVTPVYQAVPGQWSIGDVYRVQLLLRSQTPGSWVVLNDPVPAGATILGSGLGRDSAIAAQSRVEEPQEAKGPWPTFVERGFDSFRAYYEYLPTGETTVSYTVRLGTAGAFQMPGARVEALYQPDVHGVLPDGGVLRVQDGAAAANQ